MLMQIATWSDRIGGNASNLSRLLPPDYNTIDKITLLDEITFKRLVKDGTICPTLQRNEVSKMQLPPVTAPADAAARRCRRHARCAVASSSQASRVHAYSGRPR